jgi:hypothetical protein
MSYFPPEGLTGIHEVTAAIAMPKFDSTKAAVKTSGDAVNVALRPEVIAGLKEYVAIIASLYRENQFHNFEVCSAFFESFSPNKDKIAHRLVVQSRSACLPRYNEC